LTIFQSAVACTLHSQTALFILVAQQLSLSLTGTAPHFHHRAFPPDTRNMVRSFYSKDEPARYRHRVDNFRPCAVSRDALVWIGGASVSGFKRCFVATGSRASAASAVMLAAVTAGVPSAEILPAAVEALGRMPAASHVEAA
jgi:hypothetical protein